MKSTFLRILAVLLLAVICLSAVSCETETPSAYTTLRDHIHEKVEMGKAIRLPCDDPSIIPFIYMEKNASGEEALYLSVQALSNDVGYRVDIRLEPGHPDSLVWIYRQVKGDQVVARAETKLELHSYTGTELISFDSALGFPLSELTPYRVYATDLTNAALLALDEYGAENLGITVADFGFVSLADSFRHTDEQTSDYSDLGGAFSKARVSYALRMTLLGVTMVFSVLGLLWAVLAIFRKVFTAPKKPEKATTAVTEPAVAPVPTPAADGDTDDGAVVAAITAAVAAMIESDPTLREQFVGGFRVVSFRKKSAKTAWNG